MNQSLNVEVVKALMHLRGMTLGALADYLQVQPSVVQRLLSGDATAVPEYRVPEILAALGVHGEAPRADVVHYWRVSEGLFSPVRKDYAALLIATAAFGAPKVVFLASEEDPALSVKGVVHFGLRFPTFYAILEVTPATLRNVKFDPAHPDLQYNDTRKMGLHWMEGSVGLLLERREYLQLGPGALEPQQLIEQVESVQNLLKWEQLSDLAKAVKISPDQLASVIKMVASNQLPAPQDGPARENAPPDLVAPAANAQPLSAPLTAGASYSFTA